MDTGMIAALFALIASGAASWFAYRQGVRKIVSDEHSATRSVAVVELETAIQYLSARNQELEARVSQLENDRRSCMDELAKLKTEIANLTPRPRKQKAAAA